MSKPVKTIAVCKESETLSQALALLELEKSGQSGKMVRIGAELSQSLSNDNNYQRMSGARNLDELLECLEDFTPQKMLRVPCSELLQAKYPSLARSAFL